MPPNESPRAVVRPHPHSGMNLQPSRVLLIAAGAVGQAQPRRDGDGDREYQPLGEADGLQVPGLSRGADDRFRANKHRDGGQGSGERGLLAGADGQRVQREHGRRQQQRGYHVAKRGHGGGAGDYHRGRNARMASVPHQHDAGAARQQPAGPLRGHGDAADADLAAGERKGGEGEHDGDVGGPRAVPGIAQQPRSRDVVSCRRRGEAGPWWRGGIAGFPLVFSFLPWPA